jgi:adenylate cyclase
VSLEPPAERRVGTDPVAAPPASTDPVAEPRASDPAARLRHELRTPLNHIIGYAEMLLEELADDERLDLATGLAALHADARQFLAALNKVLAHGQAGRPDLEAARGALGPPLERIRAAGEALRRRAAEVGRSSLLPDLDRIHGAAERLDQLLRHGGVPPTQDRAPEVGRAPSGRGDEAQRRGTILVVDDNDDNRDLLARRLTRQGYEVRVAAGGQEALAALAAWPVDLVLLDVMMPDLDGYAVLQRLKRDPALRDIPVLMISALDELDSVVRCIQLGAEDYLSKPFDPVLLQARIGACLEKKRLHDQEVRHLGELAEWNRTLELRVAEQVAQLERLGRLKRFFSPQLAEAIVSGGAEDPLRTHRREVTVVFLDLRGFTAFAEMAEPEEVMGVLREYHAEMGRLVLEHEGTLERFTGDGMMIFFNDPVEISNPAEHAIRMAIAMRQGVARLAIGWRKRGWELALGVGIAQGYATIGAIGFEGRWDYGAIGTVTNLAARLCGEASGGQILISGRVAAAVEALIEAEELGALTLKGLARPVPTWSVLALRSPGGSAGDTHKD